MSITIDNPEIERRLEALGARQPVPVRKRAMAQAILAAAVADDRGHPVERWRDRAKRFARGASSDDK